MRLRVSKQAAAVDAPLRLRSTLESLHKTHDQLAGDVRIGINVDSAVDWLLDNHQLLSSQGQSLLRDLPRSYYGKLPRLSNRGLQGEARIMALATELIQHSDGRLDAERMLSFLGAFQKQQPLTLGELWAWPIVLKLALLERVRSICVSVTKGQAARKDANTAIESWSAGSTNDIPASPPHTAYISQVRQRSLEVDPRATEIESHLTTLLERDGITMEAAIRAEHQRQAIDQASIGHAITGFRLCATLDWHAFVEQASCQESILRRDPSGHYPRMDFQSRDAYRHALEDLAGESALAQIDLATKLVAVARGTQASGPSQEAAHLGYHLLGPGRALLETRLEHPVPRKRRLARTILRHATPVYLGSIAFATTVLVAAAWSYASVSGSPWLAALAAIVTLIPASSLVVSLVQRVIAAVVPARRLPRLDFSDGVPPEATTIVVIPTLLSSVVGVRSLLEHLEVQALGNLDRNIHFALLTDFLDASEEDLPGDHDLLAVAGNGITALNLRYEGSRFLLLHRQRRWNESEGKFMGWERKRGKLEEFNRLARGDPNTSYLTLVGDISVLAKARYALTLDADTRLPRGSAAVLAGIMAHPLNRPVVDPLTGRVVSGFGILQPRINVTHASASRSLFSTYFAGHTDSDPYTTAVSDTYQDFFGTGVYVGKGLYDIDVFMATLAGRVPDNALLSHDLFEGLFARPGLVTDVELVDDFPLDVLSHQRRAHRWMRGDWQLLGWLARYVRTSTGRVRNSLPLIARWKILDNLRRSLAAPALLTLLICGWTILPGDPLIWTAAGLAAIALPLMGALLEIAAGLPIRGRAQAYLVDVRQEAKAMTVRAGMQLILLPFAAVGALDAVLRTLWRMGVSQRHLLEWETAESRSLRKGGLVSGSLPGYFLAMGSSPLVALAIAGLAILAGTPALACSLPFVLTWIIAPVVAYHIGQPILDVRLALGRADCDYLHGVARRSWRYFEHWVGPTSNGLPPDNFQELPALLAARTSPTNIGMGLLAIQAAHDLDMITTDELVRRIDQCLSAAERLEKHEGHLFNWYSTETGSVLNPRYVSTVDSGNLACSLVALAEGCREVAKLSTSYQQALEDLAVRCLALADGMRFGFLYDRGKQLFAIGYHPPSSSEPGRLDAARYDLLASESRLASFFAIAKGDVPQSHWFHLGRNVVSIGGTPTLVSWSATMFEYLLPNLLMRSYPGTLLDQTCRKVVSRQIEYAASRGVPWGVSESAYDSVDRAGVYQYKAFGVPGLGLKRGLGDELVIAPYATALGALVDPVSAVSNLKRLEALGALGEFGFYEALDFTDRSRTGSVKQSDYPAGSLVRATFAHHQGMSLVAFAEVLVGSRMSRRFHRDPRVQATELLLQERVPRKAPLIATNLSADPLPTPSLSNGAPRRFFKQNTAAVNAQILSNGKYRVIVSNAGGGSSLCGSLAITRWRDDPTCDPGSQFIYLRDIQDGRFWSATHQPTAVEADKYLVEFYPEKALFQRLDSEIQARLEISVSPEADCEVRRLTLGNRSTRTREIEVTSYVELSLSSVAEDVSHPAFGKLFIETEWLPDCSALLARRRPRSSDDPSGAAFHVLAIEGAARSPIEFETDRMRFLGRGRTPELPQALDGRALSGTTGAVLDPILSLRTRLRLAPGESTQLTFTTGYSEDSARARVLCRRFNEAGISERTFSLAYTDSMLTRRHLGITVPEARLFERLGSAIFFTDSSSRSPESLRLESRLGQSSLWKNSVSGDLPIVLVRIISLSGMALLRLALVCHEYWRLKGFWSDLIVINAHPSDYRDTIQAELRGAVEQGPWAARQNRTGGVFLLRGDQLSPGELLLMESLARVVLDGTLADLMLSLDRAPIVVNHGLGRVQLDRADRTGSAPRLPTTLMENGIGGFDPSGREYIIHLTGDQATPLPWCNVIANPGFGTLVTELGSSHTWAGNSRENRLTPFVHDPISDPTSEAILIRDEHSGARWGGTPGVLARSVDSPPWVVRHSAGVSRFLRAGEGIHQELTIFVAQSAPIKFSILELSNHTPGVRELTLTSYQRWSLSPPRPGTPPLIETGRDPSCGALWARNNYSDRGAEPLAFAAVSEPSQSSTSDRTEFLGRNGSLNRAAAWELASLSNRFGLVADPCAASMVRVRLSPGETKRIVFILGQASDLAQVRLFVQQFCSANAARQELSVVEAGWDRDLGVTRVSTPDDSFDLLFNRWLLYQDLSCRVWARSGFYQPSGAYGFRDQLQDVLALLHCRPDVAREHLLRVASRQFVQGDVQHWWNGLDGRGIRSRCSDDLLWLPYAMVTYIQTTGDTDMWSEVVEYLDGPAIPEGEPEVYGAARASGQFGTILEHCLLAIDRSLPVGSHGLPFIGSGDWNDGFNRVGAEGRGESVFVGWFLYAILVDYISICESSGDEPRAQRYRSARMGLAAMLDQSWDGEWYRRAYFDDGTPLGTAADSECRIDALAQAWAVLSGGADPVRAGRAMDAVRSHLVKRNSKVILLLTPAFDRGARDPGYIQGYLPGIRENGGQYTHAALWVIQALTRLGSGDDAAELFHMLNPINHSRQPAGVERYMVEPYVVAGDVYDHPMHAGRGGWTWFTGSAGLMHRVALEGILGFVRRGQTFGIDPCIPSGWPRFTLEWRCGRSAYSIVVENPHRCCQGVTEATLDGQPVDHRQIPIREDGGTFRVLIRLGPPV